MIERLVARLGVVPDPDRDRTLVSALLGALRSRKTGIDRLFFDWRGGRVPAGGPYDHEAFADLKAALVGRQVEYTHPYWSDPDPCSMLIDEVEAIWSAIADHDDWAPFERKVDTIRRMGDALASPPLP